MKIQLSDHFTLSKLLRFVFPSIIMMIFPQQGAGRQACRVQDQAA